MSAIDAIQRSVLPLPHRKPGRHDHLIGAEER